MKKLLSILSLSALLSHTVESKLCFSLQGNVLTKSPTVSFGYHMPGLGLVEFVSTFSGKRTAFDNEDELSLNLESSSFSNLRKGQTELEVADKFARRRILALIMQASNIDVPKLSDAQKGQLMQTGQTLKLQTGIAAIKIDKTLEAKKDRLGTNISDDVGLSADYNLNYIPMRFGFIANVSLLSNMHFAVGCFLNFSSIEGSVNFKQGIKGLKDQLSEENGGDTSKWEMTANIKAKTRLLAPYLGFSWIQVLPSFGSGSISLRASAGVIFQGKPKAATVTLNKDFQQVAITNIGIIEAGMKGAGAENLVTEFIPGTEADIAAEFKYKAGKSVLARFVPNIELGLTVTM